MKKLLVAAMVALTLTACGDKPVPDRGTVSDRNFQPAWIQVIPGYTMCSGTPVSCWTTPMQMIPWPNQWSITIRDHDNADWEGTVTDDNSDHYDKCNVGDQWPDCWQAPKG